MKKYLLLLFLTLVCLTSGQAEVRYGTLPNGMTYYIRENSSPSGMTDIFLAQRAGSVNEAENQRGLAHFLEHICFNGTEHFPGNTLISWLESKGVKFGKNLNAYTSTDETIYNISKIPSGNHEVIDSCLLIVRDWCCGLTLAPDAIDAERGVIQSEWRHRNSAANRQLERILPTVYPGNIYGSRMPIGLMDVVMNFKPSELREFYDKWYHPANQAVIVVGDIDAESVEAEIIKLFGAIDRKGEVIVSRPVVAENESLIVASESDPEQATNLIQLFFRHPDMTDEVASELAGTMLASRFDDIELDPDCPHTYLGVGDTKFLLAGGEKAFVMRGVAKPGRATDAVKLWYSELSRVLRHGFTDSEFDAAKRQYRKSLEDKLRKSVKTSSTDYARAYCRNFIERSEPTEIAEDINRKLAELDTICIASANDYIRQIADTTGRNVVIVSYMPEREGYERVSKEALESAFFSVNSIDLTPYKTEKADFKIMDHEPAEGEIVSVRPYIFDGAEEMILSNGIKVIAWKSDSHPDQIFIRGIGRGGLSINYADSIAPTLKMINEILAGCGVGPHCANDLKRLTAGRSLNTSINISNTEEIIEASTNREDMTDAFRLIYQKSTDVRLDTLAVAAMLASERNKLRNQHVNAIQVMGDSIHRNVYSRHPLGAKATVETIDRVDPQVALDVYSDRFADMSDFTFYVAGDFDSDSLSNCLKRYVALLPTGGRIEKPRDIGYRFTQKNQTIDFSRKMESPVAVVYNFFTGNGDYDLDHVIAATILGQVIKNRLLADLREDKGWTYSIQGHCSVSAGMNGDDAPAIMMPSYIKVEPGHEDEVNRIVNQTLNDLLRNGVTSTELESVKEYLIKNYNDNINDNGYRLAIMKAREKFGRDMHTDYVKSVESMTDIRPYIKDLNRYHTTLIMRSE